MMGVIASFPGGVSRFTRVARYTARTIRTPPLVSPPQAAGPARGRHNGLHEGGAVHAGRDDREHARPRPGGGRPRGARRGPRPQRRRPAGRGPGPGRGGRGPGGARHPPGAGGEPHDPRRHRAGARHQGTDRRGRRRRGRHPGNRHHRGDGLPARPALGRRRAHRRHGRHAEPDAGRRRTARPTCCPPSSWRPAPPREASAAWWCSATRSTPPATSGRCTRRASPRSPLRSAGRSA